MVIKCAKCGKDISKRRKYYDHSTPYCEACYGPLKAARKRGKQKKRTAQEMLIKRMYERGMRPSAIAIYMGRTTREVYDILGDAK